MARTNWLEIGEGPEYYRLPEPEKSKCIAVDRCEYKTPVRPHEERIDQCVRCWKNPLKYERPIFLPSIEVYPKNRAHLY
jgi:hypothetical protein